MRVPGTPSLLRQHASPSAYRWRASSPGFFMERPGRLPGPGFRGIVLNSPHPRHPGTSTVLDSTHVLISRPEPECSELAERLAAEGFQAICLPAFEFRASGEEVDPDGIWRNSEPRLAVFTSTRSVTFGLAAVPADFFDEVLLASVGPATSHLLQTAGMRVTIQPESDFSSEGLLAHPLLSSPVAGGGGVDLCRPGRTRCPASGSGTARLGNPDGDGLPTRGAGTTPRGGGDLAGF